MRIESWLTNNVYLHVCCAEYPEYLVIYIATAEGTQHHLTTINWVSLVVLLVGTTVIYIFYRLRSEAERIHLARSQWYSRNFK